MSWVGILTLAGIASLLVLVSLSLLQHFATSENELDARRTLAMLAALTEESTVLAGERTPLELARERPDLRRQLVDHRLLDDGRLVRHGYVFECARAPGAPGWLLRAWPLRYGRTGFKAYLLEPGGPLRAVANETAPWSGIDNPPPFETQADPAADLGDVGS